jgi:hypothetical protein
MCFPGPDLQSPFDEFRPFPATLSQQPLKLLHHHNHHNNSREYLVTISMSYLYLCMHKLR